MLDAARYGHSLTVEQASVLVAAVALRYGHPGPAYADWRYDHLDTEHALEVAGVLHADHNPNSPEVDPDVLYSLGCGGMASDD